MVYLAIWLCTAALGIAATVAWRQHRLAKQLEKQLAESELKTDKLASYVQRAMEDTYVLSMLMAERGHLEPEAMERGRERWIKKVKPAVPEKTEPVAERNRTLH
ncbi:MAG: hypothetical protein IT381_07840 [Deltaproteobacteria bacterium]|nr:hypothetical protein [Deltaproteobacteria bacterium]